MNRAEQFFYNNAGYSYNPKTQTPEEGHIESAKHLAHMETLAEKHGLEYIWEHDPATDSSEFRDDCDPYPLWGCICVSPEGEHLNSLWGIDFGPDGEPWGDNYQRVVEAELVHDALMTLAAI